ncbi:DUF427-domain-containing protein [Microthyrium microscopicum]|uniref:DUF427-domain-containing protein n=1 Tax=Microthyrium microscopicum TaxID=703497 RepID=A0A6A6UH21_9PEZI|nr:DUF427-domain-containing protein [Microthyrium microscopicum]
MAGPPLQDLAALANHFLTEGPTKFLDIGPRRIRVLFNGVYIVDTTAAKQVWEHHRYPQFYVPLADVKQSNISTIKTFAAKDGQNGASILKIEVNGSNGKKTTDRALAFGPGAGQLNGLVRLEFSAMDKWFEEDTPIYIHPKDPFKRIDILPSTRPIQIKIANHTIASSNWSAHLNETGLPTRFYLPLTSVDPSVLRPSDLRTGCPYKGVAEYYHVEVGGRLYENIVWYYRTPTQESAGVADLVCFYNEKVDILLDGEELVRPKTHFG